MREPTFWILTALTAAPLHGYGIIQQADQLSDGRVRLQAGTLYAALDRLVAEGLVEPDREEKVDGRNRRYYRLTDDGVDSNVMLWSTDGFPTMMNGVASYTTPNHQALRDVMQTFPSRPSLDMLRQFGIRSVVVIHDRVTGTPYEAALNAPAVPGITRRDVGADVIYTLDN